MRLLLLLLVVCAALACSGSGSDSESASMDVSPSIVVADLVDSPVDNSEDVDSSSLGEVAETSSSKVDLRGVVDFLDIDDSIRSKSSSGYVEVLGLDNSVSASFDIVEGRFSAKVPAGNYFAVAYSGEGLVATSFIFLTSESPEFEINYRTTLVSTMILSNDKFDYLDFYYVMSSYYDLHTDSFLESYYLGVEFDLLLIEKVIESILLSNESYFLSSEEYVKAEILPRMAGFVDDALLDLGVPSLRSIGLPDPYEWNIDTDGDGMVDMAEIKYGYNRLDPASKPVFVPGDSNYEVLDELTGFGVEIRNRKIVLHMKKDLFAYIDSVRYFDGYGISLSDCIDGGIISDSVSDSGDVIVRINSGDPFSADRYLFEYKFNLSIFDTNLTKNKNRISFLVDDAFEDRDILEEYLARLSPIMHKYLGNPAATFTMEVVPGNGSSHDNGRLMKIKKDGYSPFTVIHEILHGWRGVYYVNYGGTMIFEEGYAMGAQYQIWNEYMRCYPDDIHSGMDDHDVKRFKPEVVDSWPDIFAYYDFIKKMRFTSGSNANSDRDSSYYRYSISSYLYRLFCFENPDFYKEFNERFLDLAWSDKISSRDDLMNIYKYLVPEINGKDTYKVLDSLPVMKGEELKGFYVVNNYNPFRKYNYYLYGAYASGYVRGVFSSVVDVNGLVYNGISGEYDRIPDWVTRSPYRDGYKVDFRPVSPMVTTTAYSGNSYSEVRNWDPNFLTVDTSHEDEGISLSVVEVDFAEYSHMDAGARESFYHVNGSYEYVEDNPDKFSLFVAIDGAPDGSYADILVGEKTYVSEVSSGVCVVDLTGIDAYFEGKVQIDVNSPSGVSRRYWRTIIESSSRHAFLIVDKDFNGIEDDVE